GDFSNSTVGIAVSQTTDPRGNWYLYSIQFPITHGIDFPITGTDFNKFVLSVNEYSDTGYIHFLQSHVVVVDKNDLMNNIQPLVISHLTDPNNFAVTPVKSVSLTSPIFMVTNDGYLMQTNRITVFKIAGTAASPVVSYNDTSTLSIHVDPPFQPQFGTTAQV